VASVSVLTGCIFDHRVEWQEAKYEVSWTDTTENRTLSRRIANGATIGRVESEIVGVGSNPSFIVALSRSAQTGELRYFVVDKEKDNDYYNSNEITEGPMNEAEFSTRRSERNFPEITKTFGSWHE
jgi:hypothetical protein